MSDAAMAVTISKAAQALIEAGKAKYSSGGVRLMDGTLVELYKLAAPTAEGQTARILSKAVSKVLADPQSLLNALPAEFRGPAMNLAETLLNQAIGNPQKTAQIAEGLLKTAGTAAANLGAITSGAAGIPNLYMTFQNGQKLNRVLQSVTSLNSIAWAGTAIGSANLALSAVSFAVLSSKIDGLSNKLDTIAEEIKQEMRKIQTEGMVLDTQILIDNLMSTVHILEKDRLTMPEAFHIESFLNEAKNTIQWWVNKFNNSDCEESEAIFTLLFDLSAMYAAVLKEYGAQYFYLNGSYPGNYDSWVQVFRFIDEPELKKKLKQMLWASNPVALTETLADSFDFTLNTIHLQVQDLAEYKEIVPTLPKEAHFDFDAFMKEKIEKGEVEVVEQAENDDPREAILLQKNGYAAV